jgi:exonuclease III
VTTNGNNDQISADLESFQIAKAINCDVERLKDYIVPSSNNLCILSQNIRSISCNIDSLYAFMHRARVDWDIIVLTECWLKRPKPTPTLDGYSLVQTKNHQSPNEGIVLYYKSYLNPQTEEPVLCDANCLILKLPPSTCIIAIYRPPSHRYIHDFITSLDALLSNLSCFKNIIIMGDINIDISPDSRDSRQYEYLNLLARSRYIICP